MLQYKDKIALHPRDKKLLLNLLGYIPIVRTVHDLNQARSQIKAQHNQPTQEAQLMRLLADDLQPTQNLV